MEVNLFFWVVVLCPIIVVLRFSTLSFGLVLLKCSYSEKVKTGGVR